MADELNLEDIAVKIIGDPAPYVQALESAKRATEYFYKLGGEQSATYQQALQQEDIIQRQLAESERARQVVTDAGRRITQSVATAEEVYARKVSDLNTLLEHGAVSQDTFTKKLKEYDQQLASTQPKVMSFTEQLQKLATTGLSAVSMLGVQTNLLAAFTKSQDIEKFNLRLNSGIENAGGMIQQTGDDYRAFAKTIGDTTEVTHQQTMTLLQQATAYGLVGEAAKKAVKDAIALGAIRGTSPDSFIRQTAQLAKADEDPEARVQRLRFLIPALAGIKDNTLLVAMANAELAKGFKLAEASGQTLTAQVARAKSTFMLLNTEIGKGVGAALAPLVGYLGDAARWFETLDSTTKGNVANVIALAASFTCLSVVLPKIQSGLVAVVQAIDRNPVPLITAGLVGVAAVVSRLVISTTSLGESFREMNAELERSDELTKKIADRELKGIDVKIEEGKQLGEVEGREEQLDFLKKQQAAASKLVESRAAYVEKLKDQQKQEGLLTQAGTAVLTPAASLSDMIFGTGFKSSMDASKTELKDAQKLLDAARDAVTKLANEQEKLAPKKLVGEVGALETDLAKRIDLLGKSRDEVKRYELAAKGATDADLEWVDTLLLFEDALKASMKLGADVEHLAESLQTEMDTMFMTANEKKLYKLESEGASEADLKHVKVLSDLDEVMKAHHDVLKQGEQTTKQFMTPYEKYTEAIQKYSTEFELGTIKYDTYARAVKHAQDALEKADHAAQHAAGSFHAAATGSAEAASRLDTYLSGLNLAVKKANPFEPTGLNEAKDAAYEAKKDRDREAMEAGKAEMKMFDEIIAAAEKAVEDEAKTTDWVNREAEDMFQGDWDAAWEKAADWINKEAEDMFQGDEGGKSSDAVVTTLGQVIEVLKKIAENTGLLDNGEGVVLAVEEVEL